MYFEDDPYGAYYSVLCNIEKHLASLEELAERQLSVDYANNMLLQKISQKIGVEERISHLSESLEKYSGKNLLFVNPLKQKCIDYALHISQYMASDIVFCEPKQVNDLFSKIANMNKNESIFIDLSVCFYKNEIINAIKECIKNRMMNATLGSGEYEKKITLDYPEIYMYIYVDCMDKIPESLFEYFDFVE